MMVNGRAPDNPAQNHICPNIFHMLQHMEELRRTYGTEQGYQQLAGAYRSLLEHQGLSKDLADTWYSTAGLALCGGEKFFITPAIGGLIDEAAQKIGDRFELKPELFPAIGGFCWLAEPNRRIARIGGVYGVSWLGTVCTGSGDPDRIVEMDITDATDVLFHFWVLLNEAKQFLVVPGSFYKVPLSEVVTQDKVEANSGSSGTSFPKLQWYAAFLHFINQRILELHPEPIPRASSKRLQLPDTPSARRVNVVQLRRTVYAGDSNGTHRPVDWTCRWMVRGHWRHRYYAKGRTHKLLWINPHVKGPSDKPLRASTRLFSVMK
jgi:hypothetical protein